MSVHQENFKALLALIGDPRERDDTQWTLQAPGALELTIEVIDHPKPDQMKIILAHRIKLLDFTVNDPAMEVLLDYANRRVLALQYRIDPTILQSAEDGFVFDTQIERTLSGLLAEWLDKLKRQGLSPEPLQPLSYDDFLAAVPLTG
jgi:hypothetical protein